MEKCARGILKCAAVTTHHGLNHAGNAKSSFLRVFWIGMVMLAYSCFFFHLSTLLRRYYSYPISTNTEYRSVPFSFPDITICNLLPFSIRKLEQKYGSLEVLNVASVEQFTALVEEADFPVKDFFVICSYQDKECDYSVIQKIYDPDYNLCFRIPARSLPIKKNAQNAELHVTFFVDSQHRHSLPRLNTNNSAGFMTGKNWDSTGIRVVVHEPGTYPHPNKNGFDISTGVSAKVALTPERVELLRFVAGQGKCEVKRGKIAYCDIHRKNQSSFTRTRLDCTVEKLQKRLHDSCGCVSHSYGIPVEYCAKNVSDCRDLEESNPAFRCAEEELDKFFEVFDQITKSCLVPCVSNNWKAEVSSAGWPNHLVEDNVIDWIREKYQEAKASNGTTIFDEVATADDKSIDKYGLVKKNMIKLVVHPAVLAGNRIYEEAAYPLPSFLGELGGIIGLWGGCSVLTFFEPASFLLSYFGSLISGKKKNKKVERPTAASARNNDTDYVAIPMNNKKRKRREKLPKNSTPESASEDGLSPRKATPSPDEEGMVNMAATIADLRSGN